jgi:hypothetical protein
MENAMQKSSDKLAPRVAPRTRRAQGITAAMCLSAILFSCSDPRLVILDFASATAPTLSASSAAITYSWSFTPATSARLAETDGLPVDARLYKRTAVDPVTGKEERILAAEALFSLTSASGSAKPCDFAITSILSSGTYYVEFSFADDLGPQVIVSPQATL